MKLIETNNKKGITLIALVITIIVLLILAGVSISMLTGDNSLLGNAQKTGPANNIGAAKDEVGLAYNTAMQEYYETKYASTNSGGTTFEEKLGTAINEITEKGRNHGCTITYTEGKITITNGGYKVIGTVDTTDGSAGISWGEMKETTGIDLDKVTLKLNISDASKKTGTLTATLSKISGDITWTSSDTSIATVSGNKTTATVTGVATGDATITASCNVKGKEYSSTCKVTVTKETEPITTAKDYKGYYADTDGEPSTVEGIIFADLAHDGSGQWKDNDGNYSYSAVTSGLKEYYISKDSYTDKNAGYGTTGVISAKEGTSGADRFYVMSLSDFDGSTHYWYNSAYGKMNDYSKYTSTAFGKGKENTQKMITKWNSSGYGAQNDNDMWKLIQAKYSEGWFVPSRDEWSAFAVMLKGKGKGLDTSKDSSNFGLQSWYWASSQYGANNAWLANFDNGYMNYNDVGFTNCVRLASTF